VHRLLSDVGGRVGMASSSVARCRHQRFQLWTVGVVMSLDDVFTPLEEVVQPLWPGWGPNVPSESFVQPRTFGTNSLLRALSRLWGPQGGLPEVRLGGLHCGRWQ
jgi:hypothetical protein